MKKKSKLLATLFFSTLFTSGCAMVVDPGEAGLRWHPVTSGLDADGVNEGFYLYWPWDDILTYSLQWRTYTERVDILTKDDLHVRVDASVIVRIMPNELYKLQMEVGKDYYPNIVKPEFQTTLRSELANYIMVEVPEKSSIIEKKVAETLRSKIKSKYIEVDAITIDHIEFTAAMLNAIEIKLAKEQEEIQKSYELKIAVKDAEIVRVDAKGKADAIMIIAKGKAEAQKIIDKTLTKKFLQYKAFDSTNSKFIYVPMGSDGLPLIVTPEAR